MRALTISFRLWLLVGLFALGIAIMVGCAITYQYDAMVSERVSKIAAISETAEGVVAHYQDLVSRKVYTEEEGKKQALAAIAAMGFENGNYLVVQTERAVVLYNVDPGIIGKDLWNSPDKRGVLFRTDVIPRAIRDGAATVTYYWPRAGKDIGIKKIGFYRHDKNWGWLISAGVYVDDIDATMWHNGLQFSLVGAIVLIVLVSLVFVVIRSITRPISSLGKAMTELAQGQLDVPIEGTANRDEVGQMARTVQVFKDNANQVAELRQKQEQMREDAAKERKESMNKLASEFEASILGIVEDVAGAASDMQNASQSLSTSAQQASAQASSVAASSEQASSNVQTVAAAAEQLTASIGEISRQVAEAARISADASEETARTNEMVRELAFAADKIGEVVNLINDIASQTNLLALNATIEAARAGEAGKGFAVVANEVKHLATQTARATGEINTQISSVQEETKRAVAAIKQIGDVIEQVKLISSGIASAVEEQGAATRGIAANVEQAARGAQEVSSNIHGITEVAETTRASANNVLSSATGLSRNSQRLNEEVARFLGGVRSA